jgi:hypothetical protein
MRSRAHRYQHADLREILPSEIGSVVHLGELESLSMERNGFVDIVLLTSLDSDRSSR